MKPGEQPKITLRTRPGRKQINQKWKLPESSTMRINIGPTGGVSPAGNIYIPDPWEGGVGSVSSVLLLAYIDFDVDLSTR